METYSYPLVQKVRIFFGDFIDASFVNIWKAGKHFSAYNAILRTKLKLTIGTLEGSVIYYEKVSLLPTVIQNNLTIFNGEKT